MNTRVLIISFSGRNKGNSQQIAELIKANLNADADVFLFSENVIHPCGGCRYQCFDDNRMCPHIEDAEYGLLEQISLCDQVYFIVPNYCDYPCANFFIFNERSQVFFQGYPERLSAYEAIPKKFIVISNSESTNFDTAFAYHCAGKPNILYLHAKQYGRSSIAGDLMKSDLARQAVLDFIGADPENDVSAAEQSDDLH